MPGKQHYGTLQVADGTSMEAYSSTPATGSGTYPGLMLFQEAYGVNHHIRSLADRFANEGYVVIAPELFHRTASGFEGNYADFGSVAPHMQALTDRGLEADVQAAWNWLQSQPNVRHERLASVGYCMGGRVSFLANCILPLTAAISYYGGRIVPDLVKRTESLYAPMLFFWGGLDRHIPHEHVEAVMSELRRAGKPHINVEISYADHAFFCDERPNYNAEAARESWLLTLAFLKEKMGES
jgi:carboxymethylenebutenolidase